MAAIRNPAGNRTEKVDIVTEILDFGQDSAVDEVPDLTERIRKVKAKIEEINERIARLTQRIG
jgi:TolA-binding protein